ncbi:MAG: DUF4956 domain-containing protein [Mangrovibacterium sp.]
MEPFASLLDEADQGSPKIYSMDIWELLFHAVLNFIVIGVIIHLFYYPKSKRRDYYFTFFMISVSVFFLIFLLGSVKLKIGFALGIFAIFSIIRYRTESVPIREMTYLFTITAISVINGLALQIDYRILMATNTIFLLINWILEGERWLKHTSDKLVLYDKIQLITPNKYEELKADLSVRTGLTILKVEVGHIDFLRDAALLKVYYESGTREINTADHLTRLPREDEKF